MLMLVSLLTLLVPELHIKEKAGYSSKFNEEYPALFIHF